MRDAHQVAVAPEGACCSLDSKQPNEQRPTGFNDLSPACFVAVFARLSAAATARAMCVHPLWAEYLRDDILWRPYLQQVYAKADPVLPDGSQGVSSRAAFQGWSAHFTGLPQDVVSRALHMWEQLDGWLQQHAPFVANSLRPGATAAAVAEAEARLGVKLPSSLAAILRVHDGQSLDFDRAFDSYVSWRVAQEEPELAASVGGPAPAQPPRWHPSMVWGLFGGYAFYDHLASVRLFPLDRIVWWTRFFRSHQGTQLPPNLVVVGGSASLSKLLLVDVMTGDVAMGGPQEHLPAAPRSGEACDGVLRWMEEWANRLTAGWYAVDELGPGGRGRSARGIVLFPVSAPHMATAVTRGLQVNVSSVFAPEMGGEGMARYFFGYSVRFRLMSAEEQRRQGHTGPADAAQQQCQGSSFHYQDERQQQQQQHSAGPTGSHSHGSSGDSPLTRATSRDAPGPSTGAASLDASGSSAAAAAAAAVALRRCQLTSRHWRILGPTGELSNEVTGEGVVGEYPLLEAGGSEFVYQSCTHQAERLGFMEGGFQFVEGTIARPEGPAFDAVCPRFELRVPDYIF